jgi:hypothetical protein
MPNSTRPISRRELLRLAALGVPAAALLACSEERLTPRGAIEEAAGLDATPTAEPTPTPRPIPPAGIEERAMLPGTEWETPLIATHSGVAGSAVMFLGGVHGNEPGGWLAAEELASWAPSAGSILVIPRANLLATRALVRTTEELGDLNRLYPGSADGLPMARMAAAIVEVAQEFGVDLLIDMHESWGFFAERVQNGTAFLGQTVTSSSGPESETIVPAILERVNPRIGVERDLLVTRDQFPLQNATATSTPPSTARLGRGSSSLSLGRHVTGLTPVLVEMGQDRQSEARRVELHLEVARAALEIRGMV